MLELLSPVGSEEALLAAIESGADAVYLSGKQFGARAYAPNFTDEELAEAVRNAHLRGVLVYVTVNTLVDNSEMAQLVPYLYYLYEIGVDAIIVQDLGVAAVAKEVVPQLPLHASTQMTVHNLAGVQALADFGFSRVVLARELSLDDIRLICRRSPIEIEVFVHGALCISYSGQCLMSSLIGGRSGNRGRCAQPCRLPYTLVDEKGQDVLMGADAGEYILSPKDFNTLDDLPELIQAGVTSFKIEGRMKRAEYVAIVTDTYRKAMDACQAGERQRDTARDHKRLAQIFNRDFTRAYLSNKPGRTMMSHRRPNNRGVRIGRVLVYDAAKKSVLLKLEEELAIGDIIEFWVKVGGRVNTTVTALTVAGQSVTVAPAGSEVTIAVPSPVRASDRVFKVFDAKLMEYARGFFAARSPQRRVAITATVTAAEGQPLVITLRDDTGHVGEGATDFIAQTAIKRPLTEETIHKQIDRLGTTIFSLVSLTCHISGDIMVPVSEINEARRRAVEALETARLAEFQRSAVGAQLSLRQLEPVVRPKQGQRKPLLAVSIDTLDKLQAALRGGADVLLFGGDRLHNVPIALEEYEKALTAVRAAGKRIIFHTPRLMKEWQLKATERELALFQELQPDGISIGNIGVLALAGKLTTIPLQADYPLNIYNRFAANVYAKEFNVRTLTLSPELTLGQTAEFIEQCALETECLVHGYLTLMVSEYCAAGSFLGGLGSGPCSRPCQKSRYWLKDRKEERFPTGFDQYCRMHILNAKELSMLPHVSSLVQTGVNRLRIEGKPAQAGWVGEITAAYRRLLDTPLSGDALQTIIEKFEHQDITRGHYFRGVL